MVSTVKNEGGEAGSDSCERKTKATLYVDDVRGELTSRLSLRENVDPEYMSPFHEQVLDLIKFGKPASPPPRRGGLHGVRTRRANNLFFQSFFRDVQTVLEMCCKTTFYCFCASVRL